MDSAPFLFACCQPGAETALKRELGESDSHWRFAFSRSGFLTFKWTAERPPAPRYQLKSVFARCYGWSLGPLKGESDSERLDSLLELLSERPMQQLHVWCRQRRGPTGALPVITSDETTQFGELVRQRLVDAGRLPADVACNQPADSGQLVCDCILIAPNQWWLGWHQATAFAQRWPGGVPLITPPAEMVSRAYLKMREAVMWSGFPFRSGDRCIEIGCAPGGASQALLEAGLSVMGVDPAEMDPSVLAHPHFVHVKKRGADVRRREYRGYKWLVVDSNVAPSHSLDTVESIVTHSATSVQGLLLTLKMSDWKLSDELVDYVQRVRSWGYDSVRCRQLACNHQEVCLAALRSRGIRRRRTSTPGPQAARK